MTAYPIPKLQEQPDLTVYLVPAGRDRLELYSEAPEEIDDEGKPVQGRIRQWTRRARARWRELVDSARRGRGTSRFARWRDRLICHLAESIAEQRTLWAFRKANVVRVAYPAMMAEASARAALDQLVARARRHHGRWLVIDAILTAITGPVFFFVPGPNAISWYFFFRVVGHLLSWRGARRATDQIRWVLDADHGLAELARLVDVPRAARAQRVAAIAARLNLPRLSAFFDRVAVPQ